MTFDFFEGAAGTGKTYSLVRRAEEIVRDRALGENQKLLVLTFMNGARRRLDARLCDNEVFRGRFDCQTFDVFARILATRLRSLITQEMLTRFESLNEFDRPCALAAELLKEDAIQNWLARSYPLVLVDEAQDLDEHRLKILQGLSSSCGIVVAADPFQCLHTGRDTSALMSWLEGAGQTHRLRQVRRTSQQGLLAAALAVREGRDVKSVLTSRGYSNRITWSGAGFRIQSADARQNNTGLLAWTIANDISQRQGSVAILTPDGGNTIIRGAIDTVGTRLWNRDNGSAFGPYPFTWDRHDDEEVDAFLEELDLPASASCADFRTLLEPLAGHPAISRTISHVDRMRRVHGKAAFTGAEVEELVRRAFRGLSRRGFRQQSGHLAMTIHRAKNREFPNVIVIWPHSVTGSAEHLRRILYNGITRAQNNCTVIVIGQNRLNGPPFAPVPNE